MGYPMTYQRLIDRNGLQGGYDGFGDPVSDGVGAPQWSQMDHERFQGWPRVPHRQPHHSPIAGDMRRVEADQRDAKHLDEYARLAGITPEQVSAVLTAFFEGDF